METGNRAQRRAAGFAIIIATLAAVSSCARTARTAPSPPAAVALEYATDIYTGHADAAQSLVLAQSRSDFQILVNLMKAQALSARDLGTGATTVDQNAALVVITGTICSSGRATARPQVPATVSPKCVSNADPRTANPGFHVSLRKASDGKWYMYFPGPPTTP